jgi:hypothetical protein
MPTADGDRVAFEDEAMKNVGIGFGLAALFAVGSANAGPAVVFDTLGATNGVPINGTLLDNRNFSMTVGGLGTAGSPLADQFNLAAPMSISSISLRLTDATNTDGGSILVYLVPNQSGNTPMSSGLTLASSKILLGSILDSALPTSLSGCSITQCNTTLSLHTFATAGQYWITLVNNTDTKNGGVVEGLASSAVWWTNGNGSGIGTAGESDGHVQKVDGTFHIVSDVGDTATFEAQVQAPEPTSLALLGVGLAALGLRRRRGRGKRETAA